MRVKVCCISSHGEADLAVQHGAHALGFVSAMPSGPGVIDEALIGSIVRNVPAAVETFLLTSLTDPHRIAQQHHRCKTSTIQLVDALPLAAYPVLRGALPNVRLVQVLHVTGTAVVDEARQLYPLVDALLLDSGDPSLEVKQLGGTGRTHDWDTSARIVDEAPLPVWLAGGLLAANVAEAASRVEPYGVDLCTGVRSNGSLDPNKLRAFMATVASVGR